MKTTSEVGPAIRSNPWKTFWGILLVLGLPLPGLGQQLEPGAYSVSPVGVNILVFTYNLSRGDLNFDPSLPVEDAEATVNLAAFSYVRSLRVLGRSANIGISLPLTSGTVQGLYIGEFTKVDRTGLRDPYIRFAMNLLGAPAMDLKEFARYHQKTNIGFSAVIVPPLGQYDPSKLINLGANRWSFKPELGLSKAIGKWTLELYTGVWLFTDNTDFYNGKTREQNPIGLGQFHLLYTFKPRLWVSFNANFYTGGRTTVDGGLNQDFQRNSRFGTTISIPLNPRHSLKLAYSRGAFTTIGADFDALTFGYQFIWGGGL
jgi:hypothetical protein